MHTSDFKKPYPIEDWLSEPDVETVDVLRAISGDIIILGAGGKMGPSLALMARRASDIAGTKRRIIAVSRFSESGVRERLEAFQVEAIQGDLLDQHFLDSLPKSENVIFMVGLKFGTSAAAATTWATNAFLTGLVCQKYSDSRIVSFSTGNVYPMVPVESMGSKEDDELQPVGEYGMTALARERILEYCSVRFGIPTVILRLNYATELRYGVLVDLAQKVMREEPISLLTGYLNCIWQGDANNMTLRAFGHVESPPLILNLTGESVLECRQLCEQFGESLRKHVSFRDSSASTALLSDSSLAHKILGKPKIDIAQMIEWTSDWVAGGGEISGKSTHFEVRDGKY